MPRYLFYPETRKRGLGQLSSSLPGPMMCWFLLSFLPSETHRTVLNQILRQSTTHLADGPFAVLVDYIRVLDFDVKRKYVPWVLRMVLQMASPLPKRSQNSFRERCFPWWRPLGCLWVGVSSVPLIVIVLKYSVASPPQSPFFIREMQAFV